MWELLGVLIASCPALLVGVGVIIGWWVFWGKPASDRAKLQNKFHDLGNLKGKTRAEIERIVGQPQSWAAIGDNKISCTWNTSNHNYSINLIFNGDICEGVSHEFSV